MNYNKAHLMSGYSKNRQKNDFYATPGIVIKEIFKREYFDRDKSFLDPFCGKFNFGIEIKKFFGRKVDLFSSDLYEYKVSNKRLDFIKNYEWGIDFAKNRSIHKKYFKGKGEYEEKSFDYIVSNPPYSKEIFIPIINQCKKIAKDKICLVLKLNHLCGEKRFLANMFLDKDFPCSKIYYYVQRLDFNIINKETGKKNSPSLEYCAVVWDRSYKRKLPECDWIYINKRRGKKCETEK